MSGSLENSIPCPSRIGINTSPNASSCSWESQNLAHAHVSFRAEEDVVVETVRGPRSRVLEKLDALVVLLLRQVGGVEPNYDAHAAVLLLGVQVTLLPSRVPTDEGLVPS